MTLSGVEKCQKEFQSTNRSNFLWMDSSSCELFLFPENKREGSIKEPSKDSDVQYMLHASELCVQRDGISFVFFCCSFFFYSSFQHKRCSSESRSMENWNSIQHAWRVKCHFSCCSVSSSCQTRWDVAFEKLIMVIHSRCVENETECAINKFYKQVLYLEKKSEEQVRG